MKTLLTLLILLSALLNSACAIHKIDVQQGNIVTTDMVNQLKTGMSRKQVRFIMGTPLIIDTFNRNHWIYLYYLHGGDGHIKQYHLNINFKDDKLVSFTGNVPKKMVSTTP